MSFSSDTRYELMIRAAYYYYEREYTQTKIADMLGISRLTLGNILKDAKSHGIVKITLDDPRNLTDMMGLEAQLCDRYSLQNAIVVKPIEYTTSAISQAISLAAAQHISRTIKSGMKISLCWGRTLNLMAEKLTPDRSVTDIEVMTVMGGGGTTDASVQPGMLAGSFLSKYEGRGFVINAPFLCQSAEVCDSLKAEPSVTEILNKCKNSDITFVGIGEPPELSESYWARRFYSDDALEDIISSGAVGDICGSYINSNGATCCENLDKRRVGIDIHDLRKHKCVVALAGGKQKHKAIKAALKGGYIDFLVTDNESAISVLS